MNNQKISFLMIGWLTGVILTGTVASYAVNHGNFRMMGAFGMHDQNDSNTPTNDSMRGMDMSPSTSDSSMSMANRTSNLNGYTGDAFDKEFITEMIVHHQGAISMAKLAATQAKHQEVKDLANNILSAQSSEIIQMQAWQKQWGY